MNEADNIENVVRVRYVLWTEELLVTETCRWVTAD